MSEISRAPQTEVSKATVDHDTHHQRENPQVKIEEYEDLEEYDNLPGDAIEEHVAVPGPDNPIVGNSVGNKEENMISVMEKADTGKGFEELPSTKSNLSNPDMNAGQKCVAVAMGKIMHSPFPLMDKEEVEAVQRYLLADVGNISDIKITNLATESEEDGLFLHQIQVTAVCPFSSTSNLFSYTFILINPHPGEVHNGQGSVWKPTSSISGQSHLSVRVVEEEPVYREDHRCSL